MKKVEVNLKKLNIKQINFKRVKNFSFKSIKNDSVSSFRSIFRRFKFNLSFSIISSLVKKELSLFFSTPVGYIITVVFIVAFAVLVFSVARFTEYGTNDLSQIFGYLAFILAIAIPAITMGSISKEKQSGTIEYILTQPVRESEFVISKLISYSLISMFLILTTLPFSIYVSTIVELDIGQVVLQYIGTIILSTCLVGVGVSISSIFKSEIPSFITSVVVSAILILLGSQLLRLPLSLDNIVDKFSLISHYQSISRGVLELRDVLYFIVFILLCFVISYYLITKEKYPINSRIKTYIRNLTIFITVLILFIGYFGQQIRYRVDFTSNNIYTLSDTTNNIINNAKDLITLELYLSTNLPLELQSQVRDIENILSDYVSYSGGKISLNVLNPDIDEDAKASADSNGVSQIRFQVSNTDSSSVSVGYFGLVIKYKDTKEVLDFSSEEVFNNIEYEVTKRILKLTKEDKENIYFLSNNVETTREGNYQTYNALLSELFNVSDLEINDDTVLPEDMDVLVIAGPNGTFSEAVTQKIKSYFENGGSIFLLSNPITIVDLEQSPTENSGSLAEIFKDYGVSINKDVVYDLESNNLINVGYLFPVNYPLWIVPDNINTESPILRDVTRLSILWGSDLTVDSNKSNVTELIKTSDGSNVFDFNGINLAFDQQWQYKSSDSARTIAASIELDNKAKAVVVGDSKFLSDNFELVNQPDNLNFGLSTIEWLSNSDSVSSILSKNRAAKRIVFSGSESNIIQVVSIGTPLALLLLLGGVRYYNRRKDSKRKYIK